MRLLVPPETKTTTKKPRLINYLKNPESDIVISEINRRYKKGLGTNVFVIGLSGTGKSSTSQRLSELINESRGNKFETFIVDSLLGFVKAIRKAVEGNIIVIEEVSVLFPSRRAMSKQNVAVGAIFDTVRKKRLCVISNAPIWQSIDSHMKALGHIIIETLAIKKRKKVVVSKFHLLQTNPKTGKTYMHTFQREGKDIKLMYTKMPDKKKWEEYERKKDKFMDDLYERLESQQEDIEGKEKKRLMKKVMPPLKRLTKRELFVHEEVTVRGRTQSDVARELGVTPGAIWLTIRNIEKKTKVSQSET